MQAFVGLAMNRGWDIEALLGTAAISPLLPAEGRSRITAYHFGVLFRQLWGETDDELLGLGLESIPRGTFRLLCYAVINPQNPGTALQPHSRTPSFNYRSTDVVASIVYR